MRERVHERWADIDELLRPSAKSLREAHLAAVASIGLIVLLMRVDLAPRDRSA